MGVDDLYLYAEVGLNEYFKWVKDYSRAVENVNKMLGTSQQLLLASLSTVSEASLKSLEDITKKSIRLIKPPAELVEEAKINRMVREIMKNT